jgi:hypothetical protein
LNDALCFDTGSLSHYQKIIESSFGSKTKTHTDMELKVFLHDLVTKDITLEEVLQNTSSEIDVAQEEPSYDILTLRQARDKAYQVIRDDAWKKLLNDIAGATKEVVYKKLAETIKDERNIKSGLSDMLLKSDYKLKEEVKTSRPVLFEILAANPKATGSEKKRSEEITCFSFLRLTLGCYGRKGDVKQQETSTRDSIIGRDKVVGDDMSVRLSSSSESRGSLDGGPSTDISTERHVTSLSYRTPQINLDLFDGVSSWR